MPKMNQMFPSPFLSAADLNDQEMAFTISDVAQETVGKGDDAEVKWVVYFSEADKGLVLNKTNATSITACLGDDTDEWMSRKVVLYPTQVQFSGKMVDAIRVKEKATKVANKATPKPEPTRKTAPPVTQQEVDEDIEIPFDGKSDVWPKGRQ